jgi:uncharacterized protein
MATHPNVERIRDGYAAFAKGDFAVLNDLFAEDLLWHEPGRSQLAGDYRGREAVYEFFGRLMELSEGSFQLELQAVFADDEHGVALVVSSASRGGQSVQATDAHIFRMRDGQVAEFWNATTAPYAYDELFG